MAGYFFWLTCLFKFIRIVTSHLVMWMNFYFLYVHSYRFQKACVQNNQNNYYDNRLAIVMLLYKAVT